MLEFWKYLTYTTKFSTISFLITGILGLFSMGILGALLYYPVSFLFGSYPTLNNWRGDWVWPATIMVGMIWSVWFLFGGIAWHFLSPFISSVLILRLIYGFILWSWAAFLWNIMIKSNIESFS